MIHRLLHRARHALRLTNCGCCTGCASGSHCQIPPCVMA